MCLCVKYEWNAMDISGHCFTVRVSRYLYLTCVIRGWVHLLLIPLCSSHWFSGWGQCCLRVQRFSPLHQTHPNSGSAFRHKPQLPRWASHLYRWTVQERGKKQRERGKKNKEEGREEGSGRGRKCREVENNLSTNDYRNANECKFILGKSLWDDGQMLLNTQTKIWVVYPYLWMSVSGWKRKQQTEHSEWDIHWYLCLIISPSIVVCIYSLSLSLSFLHCCLLPLLTHHTFNISPWQQASNFLLIAIRFVCDLSIKWCPMTLLLHRQTMTAEGSVEDSLVQASPYVSPTSVVLFFF